jgi:hypothetical protein
MSDAGYQVNTARPADGPLTGLRSFVSAQDCWCARHGHPLHFTLRTSTLMESVLTAGSPTCLAESPDIHVPAPKRSTTLHGQHNRPNISGTFDCQRVQQEPATHHMLVLMQVQQIHTAYSRHLGMLAAARCDLLPYIAAAMLRKLAAVPLAPHGHTNTNVLCFIVIHNCVQHKECSCVIDVAGPCGHRRKATVHVVQPNPNIVLSTLTLLVLAAYTQPA